MIELKQQHILGRALRFVRAAHTWVHEWEQNTGVPQSVDEESHRVRTCDDWIDEGGRLKSMHEGYMKTINSPY